MKIPKLLSSVPKKEVVIITAAIIIPGGLIALGLWKAYELIKQKQKSEGNKESKPDTTP